MPTIVRRRAPRSPALSIAGVRRAGDRMLEALELGGAELSVLLCDDAAIHALNREHRRHDKPTDVLSFPIDGGRRALARARRVCARGESPLLGDVVISLDTAARQAASRRRALDAEVVFLLAHGVLHLVGHDHAEPEEKRLMVWETGRLVRAAKCA